MSRARRVVVVGRGAPERGGIPSFLALLVASADELGHEVVLVNLAEGDLREGGKASWTNVRRTVRDAGRVLRAARRGDLVHVHSALAPAVTCWRTGLLVRAARLRGARTVVHAHGGRLVNELGTTARRRSTRLALAPADAIIAVSRRVRDVLVEAGVPADTVHHIANGIDVEAYDGRARPTNDPPRLLFVGGLTARKGVLDLLAASTRLADEGVRHEVVLVGGVPDEGDAAYREVVDAVPPHATLRGAVPPEEMAGVYAQADVFCLPSWWEASPLTVLEAQASGLPVVATDVGDVATMVDDGVTGRVVPARDVDALVAALRPLLVDPVLSLTMGQAATLFVGLNFGHRRMVREIAAVFEGVLAQ